jgi:centrin-1
LFDADGGGSIEQKELESAMRALGFPLENLKLFNEIDTDGSQAIEFDEFLKYITMPISQNDDKKDLD